MFNASLILASWLCAMPPVANGFCFDCSLYLILSHNISKSHTYQSLKYLGSLSLNAWLVWLGSRLRPMLAVNVAR